LVLVVQVEFMVVIIEVQMEQVQSLQQSHQWVVGAVVDIIVLQHQRV
jgi:hypothetical protein